MGLIKERINSGEECCKLANERFGLMQSLKKAMVKLGHTQEDAVKAVEHAKKREFMDFNRILDKELNNDINRTY